jgi:caa(3)-type oxidase subunit IV
MTAHATAQAPAHGSAHAPADGSAGHGPHRNYVKIWGILVVLLVVSVTGPMFGIRVVTLIAAFGVALVKAYMVAKNFMHLDIEKPIVHYILLVALGLMVLLYGALAPDVQRGAGEGWKKDAGFHHSFTTSKPHHPGEHGKDAPAEGSSGTAEHDKP